MNKTKSFICRLLFYRCFIYIWTKICQDDKAAFKKIPSNIDRLKLDINECKRHLESLLEKLSQTEIQYLNNATDWPTLLNSFAILSSDLITISKVLKDKNAINLKNSVFVPKSFSEDVDQLLQVDIFFYLINWIIILTQIP